MAQVEQSEGKIPDTPESLALWVWDKFVGCPITEPYDAMYLQLLERLKFMHRTQFTAGLRECLRQVRESEANRTKVAAHAPSVAPPPQGEKRPIARPCSACGDDDTEMKYHDHFPPFADEPGTPSVTPPPQNDKPLQHMMNCGATGFDGYDAGECTCGLEWRIKLRTEQEMHAAWRKRAEEAEAKLSLTQSGAPSVAPSQESLNRTIAEMVEYRYKLRQITERLLDYAESIFPEPSRSGDERGAEEEVKRKSLVSAAKEILYNTAIGPVSTPHIDPADIVNLRTYVTAMTGLHNEDCPADDTCNCYGKAINDSVNKLCNLSGTPSVAEAPAPDEDELYSRHMAELEAGWEVHPIPPEDRIWINGYKAGWQQHRMRAFKDGALGDKEKK